MNELLTIDHENLSNTVYAALCDALIKGKLRTGERLRIRDLADQLGTSITPVRDAILRLVHDEALVFRSPRDIRIPNFDPQRFLEIRAIRIRLEAVAAEAAAQMATRQDIAMLEDILTQCEQAIQEKDAGKGVDLHQTFHFTLCTIAKMPILRGILRRNLLLVGPAIIAAAFYRAGPAMIAMHHPILEAIKRRDSAAAAAAMSEDIAFGAEQVMADKVESQAAQDQGQTLPAR